MKISAAPCVCSDQVEWENRDRRTGGESHLARLAPAVDRHPSASQRCRWTLAVAIPINDRKTPEMAEAAFYGDFGNTGARQCVHEHFPRRLEPLGLQKFERGAVGETSTSSLKPATRGARTAERSGSPLGCKTANHAAIWI
jgi:hypothetical protein